MKLCKYWGQTNMHERRKTLIVYSQKLAGMLMQQGFPLIDIDKNKRYPEKSIFIFYDSPSIQKSIDVYKTNYR